MLASSMPVERTCQHTTQHTTTTRTKCKSACGTFVHFMHATLVVRHTRHVTIADDILTYLSFSATRVGVVVAAVRRIAFMHIHTHALTQVCRPPACASLLRLNDNANAVFYARVRAPADATQSELIAQNAHRTNKGTKCELIAITESVRVRVCVGFDMSSLPHCAFNYTITNTLCCFVVCCVARAPPLQKCAHLFCSSVYWCMLMLVLIEVNVDFVSAAAATR